MRWREGGREEVRKTDKRTDLSDSVEERLQPATVTLTVTVKKRQHAAFGCRRALDPRSNQTFPLGVPDSLHPVDNGKLKAI